MQNNHYRRVFNAEYNPYKKRPQQKKTHMVKAGSIQQSNIEDFIRYFPTNVYGEPVISGKRIC